MSAYSCVIGFATINRFCGEDEIYIGEGVYIETGAVFPDEVPTGCFECEEEFKVGDDISYDEETGHFLCEGCDVEEEDEETEDEDKETEDEDEEDEDEEDEVPTGDFECRCPWRESKCECMCVDDEETEDEDEEVINPETEDEDEEDEEVINPETEDEDEEREYCYLDCEDCCKKNCAERNDSCNCGCCCWEYYEMNRNEKKTIDEFAKEWREREAGIKMYNKMLSSPYKSGAKTRNEVKERRAKIEELVVGYIMGLDTFKREWSLL